MTFSEQIKAATDAYLRTLGIDPISLKSAQSGLSREELAFVPEVSERDRAVRGSQPLRETDLPGEFRLPGAHFADMGMLARWKLIPASRGIREGGVPIEPDEPARAEVHEVKLLGVDIIDSLPQDVIDVIEDYLYETAREGS